VQTEASSTRLGASVDETEARKAQDVGARSSRSHSARGRKRLWTQKQDRDRSTGGAVFRFEIASEATIALNMAANLKHNHHYFKSYRSADDSMTTFADHDFVRTPAKRRVSPHTALHAPHASLEPL